MANEYNIQRILDHIMELRRLGMEIDEIKIIRNDYSNFRAQFNTWMKDQTLMSGGTPVENADSEAILHYGKDEDSRVVFKNAQKQAENK